MAGLHQSYLEDATSHVGHIRDLIKEIEECGAQVFKAAQRA